MNIVLIISDSLRADYLGCYGNPWVKTPRMDALAREGVQFLNAYVGSFPTGPMRKDTHCGRFTFSYAGWQGDFLPGEAILAECMRAHGYKTALIGDLFCLKSYQRGFDFVHHIPGQHGNVTNSTETYPLPAPIEKLRAPMDRLQDLLRNKQLIRNEEDTWVAQSARAAVRWLENQYRSKQPFFLCYDTFDPHEPWLAPKHYLDLYDPDYAGNELFEPAYAPADYATQEEIRHMRCMYAAEVTLVDHWIGHILDALRRLNMEDDTIVILTSDHGFYHGEHGLIGKVNLSHPAGKLIKRWPLYRTISQLPLIIRVPGGPKGKKQKAFCQPADFMPTILDFAGAPIPQSVQGISLKPSLYESNAKTRPFAISTTTYTRDTLVRSPSAFRTKDYLYIYGGDEWPSELYDLRKDSNEEQNIFASEQQTARKLHREYLAFLEKVDSPRERIEGRKEFNPTPRPVPEGGPLI